MLNPVSATELTVDEEDETQHSTDKMATSYDAEIEEEDEIAEELDEFSKSPNVHRYK